MERFAYLSHYWKNPALREAHFLKLAQYCLEKAADGPTTVQYKQFAVEVEAGEFILGRDTLRDDMNEHTPKPHPDDSTWWRRLKKLEAENVIEIRSTNKYSIIKIVPIAAIDAQQQERRAAHQEAAAGQQKPEAEPITAEETKPEEKPKKPKKPREPKVIKIYDDSDLAFKMSKYIHEKAASIHGSAYYYEVDYQKWSVSIDKLLNPSSWSKKGHIADTYEEREAIVREVLAWTFDHEFWKQQVRTGNTFADKFHELRVQMGNDVRWRKRQEEKARLRAESLPQGKQERTKDFLARKREEAERMESGDVATLFLNGGDGHDGEGIH